ncbi:hypothetical protein TRFO_37035 [Tritrichomonas foetus]|uniref:DUF659 domain-containing protein n=1 Tax=Tritrichomonas foetus TaxID=1144522 RepID=A0A1J4JDM2_9EUKA|nr:hypothetical protein TRFO_37035 [Tritrichomonas foetus]|eukprot:OHS96753.1 hypothetical protein TRFO_37035 [Tritrichomonas foetus]
MNIKIDAGTVNRLKCNHFILSLVEDDQPPFPFKLIKNANFDSQLYYYNANLVLKEVLNENVKICSIFVDNLRCQTKGLEIIKTLSHSLFIKSIYIVHCFCYMMSLVFSNLLKKSMHLSNSIKTVKEIIVVLQQTDAKSFISKKCPSIVETRYLCIYYILLLITANLNDGKTLLITAEKSEILNVVPEICELYVIVRPLRFFVDQTEKNYSICSVAYYITHIIEFYRTHNFI